MAVPILFSTLNILFSLSIALFSATLWCVNHVVLYCRLLMYSECFEELDLDDNLIGDLGGKEIQEGLEYRKEGFYFQIFFVDNVWFSLKN